MKRLFSDDFKFSTWRRLWIALAESEKELGLDISDAQIEQMKAHVDDIDYESATRHEHEVRHDVMAHVLTFGECCPDAKPIIHLGATSCYVGDNTDIIRMREALVLVRKKLVNAIAALRDFAEKYKSVPTLAYTHFQAAQPTTVGKRATLWMYELYLDLCDLDFVIDSLAMLGQIGTTGTQASFMELFDGDEEKIKELEKRIASDFGFSKVVPVSGQTYTRKFDSRIMNVLSGIAQSASKFANDMRLLQSFKEMEEPFEKNQIGSSAMPYKRNPMRCERICSLARYIIADSTNPAMTASTQWFERTLDDSANKRIAMSEAFLAADAILNIYINVTSELVVYPKVIESRVMAELPFIASENIMMDLVRRGGDRQDIHEKIRLLSIEAGKRVKEDGEKNDMLERICKDPSFNVTLDELKELLVPSRYTGRSEHQVEEFIKGYIDPVLGGKSKTTVELSV